MTGLDLIIYILEHDLEDKPIAENGRFLDFMTAAEVAKEKGVGVATIWVWIAQGKMDGIIIGDSVYIPAGSVS